MHSKLPKVRIISLPNSEEIYEASQGSIDSLKKLTDQFASIEFITASERISLYQQLHEYELTKRFTQNK